MNVNANAGAVQSRPSNPTTASAAPAADTTPKAQTGKTSFNDVFQPAVQRLAPVALHALNFTGPLGQAPSPQTRGGNPDIGVDRVKDAKYGHVDGTPFIQGSGDANAADWNDVQQGNLGDCYFMASAGEVAKQNPQLIQNAIKDNGDGSYTVRLYEKKGDGLFGWFGHHYEPKDIRVTPDFPVDANGNQVFAGPGDANGAQKELWPSLMEKAYAQWKGSYHGIEGGNPGDAMSMLTGKDSEEKAGKDFSIDHLDQALASGKAVVASTPGGEGEKVVRPGTSLYLDHSYMVTGVDKNAGTVTLRNPWGTWTPDVVLSIADFNKYIDHVDTNPTR